MSQTGCQSSPVKNNFSINAIRKKYQQYCPLKPLLLINSESTDLYTSSVNEQAQWSSEDLLIFYCTLRQLWPSASAYAATITWLRALYAGALYAGARRRVFVGNSTETHFKAYTWPCTRAAYVKTSLVWLIVAWDALAVWFSLALHWCRDAFQDMTQ